MIHPRFDGPKALEVLLYVAKRCPDLYTALKVIYFADRLHLERYGRLIAGDGYVAMKDGPVPSGIYDFIKVVRGDGTVEIKLPLAESFRVSEKTVIEPRRESNLDMLSKSDQDCLDESIRKYGHMSFGQLRDLSHDKAFKTVDKNNFISIEDLAKSLPNARAVLEHLNQ